VFFTERMRRRKIEKCRHRKVLVAGLGAGAVAAPALETSP